MVKSLLRGKVLTVTSRDKRSKVAAEHFTKASLGRGSGRDFGPRGMCGGGSLGQCWWCPLPVVRPAADRSALGLIDQPGLGSVRSPCAALEVIGQLFAKAASFCTVAPPEPCPPPLVLTLGKWERCQLKPFSPVPLFSIF